jgi:non-specific serine/threonine protein kinase
MSTSIESEHPQKAPHHNLPAPRSSFVGRERELTEVKRELTEATRLLTLTGAGGAGKTRLALEVARGLVDTFPDGVWLVELAPLSEGELVPRAVAAALGVPERPQESLTDTLVEVVRPTSMLLVLDNCEHLVGVVAGLADLLLDSCPRLRVLATSREALDLTGEVRWPVPPLSVPDTRRSLTAYEVEASEAARLFADRAHQRDPAFAISEHNSQAVARICRRIEGVPLAVELAAARADTLSVEQIANRLEGSLELLTRGGRTVAPRQRSLRGALGWSHGLLSEPEKTMFRRLSVFAGGWDLEAAEAVASGGGVDRHEAMDLLVGLIEKSLAVAEVTAQERARYRFLEPVRQYAGEKLEGSGEAKDIRRSHARYFLALAEEAEAGLFAPQEAEWFDRLEEEHDNIRAALSWSLEAADAELGLRLAGALRWFWNWRGYSGEGRRWLEELLANEGQTSGGARAKVLGTASLLAWDQGDLRRAKANAEVGLALSAETASGDSSPAFFWFMLGCVSVYEGELERGAELLDKSVALYRRADDTPGTVMSLGLLAQLSGTLVGHERAEELYGKAMDLSRPLGSTISLGNLLFAWGQTSLNSGDHERATVQLEEAASLIRVHGYRSGGLQCALCNLGIAVLLGEDLRRAESLLEEGLVLARELNDKVAISDGLEGFACLAGVKGEDPRAARLFGAAWALMEAIGYKHVPGEEALREPYVADVRSRMGEAAWEDALEEGRAMEPDAAVGAALSEEEPFARASAPREQPSTSSFPEYLAGLTPRETEVLKCVAGGLTNAQVAEELFLSPRTVDTHLTSIYQKIGVSSRTAAARFAVEHRLA